MNPLAWIGNAVWAIAGGAVVALFFITVIVPVEKREARKGYVLEARAIAAEAKRDEFERQINAGQIVIDSYQEVARNAKAAEQQAADAAELRIQEYEKKLKDAGHSWLLDQSDIDYIVR